MPPTILLVDDEPALRCLLALALEDAGYDVDEAGDGIQALERLGRRLPDLILSDMQMPHLDGIGLARLLAPHNPPIPIIMMSAGPCPPGCRLPFLQKPFTLNELFTLMARTLPVSGMVALALAGLDAAYD